MYNLIKSESIGRDVLSELLPDGAPHLYERELWDYKETLPVSPPVGTDEADKEAYERELSQIVKDAVSFYNSFGGYLVIGIKNQPRDVIGYDQQFDCDLLNRKIKAATRQDVGCFFALVEVEAPQGRIKFGLLFVPQRPDNQIPAQFVKDATANDKGKKAYARGSIYFRQGDECRPAETAADYSFLCSQGRRQFTAPEVIAQACPLDNNLKARARLH